MRESELLQHIADRSADLPAEYPDVILGPGDDAAVVRTHGDLCITVDQLVEDAHFEPGTPIDLIARKAIARSVSDVAAMGGRPTWALATGLLPNGYAHADELFDRMAHWARHFGCPLVGGDIATYGGDQPGPVALTVTVAGRLENGSRWITRGGAKPGDALWLTGQVGGSFESGWHLRFEPRVEHGLAASRSDSVHAMIDLSDGLGRDATRVAVASGVRIEIDAVKLPISHRARDWRQAVGEGEDYELLIVSGGEKPPIGGSASGPEPALIGPIGLVRACGEGEAPGCVILDPHGTPHDAAELGWDH